MGKNQISKYFVLIGLALVSCGEKQKTIEYDSNVLDSTTPTNASLKKIETDIEFGFPSSTDFISDSVIVVFDQNINDNIAHVVTTKGRYISGFGKKGRGEGELISPNSITFNERRDSAFIYDFMLQRVLGYNLAKVINHEEQTPSIYQIDINTIPNQKYRFSHVKSGQDGSLLCFAGEANRIVTMKNGTMQNIFTDYPLTDPDSETNMSIWNYSKDLNAISPDKSKLIIGTYVGGLFEIFDLADGSIKSRTVKGFYKPDYKYAEGAIPKCVTPNPETMVTGFRTISAGNDDFMAVIDGPECKRMNEILTFDYDGNLKKRTAVKNGLIYTVSRNDKGEIYCIALDEESKILNLYKLEQ